MTPAEIIAELEAVRADYRGILANIQHRRKVLDKLERWTRRTMNRCTKVLKRIQRATQEMADDVDAGDWWKHGPTDEN